MADRHEASQSNEESLDIESGAMEWLYDTLDEKPSPTRRAGFPWLTLVVLLVGIAVVGAVLWLLLGPPLLASRPFTAETTATPTATAFASPTPVMTAVVVVATTTSPTPTPGPPGAFEIGDRVIITGTATRGLRLRAGAGTEFATLDLYEDGDAFFVMPAPDDASTYPILSGGYLWWQLRSPEGLIGWTVEDFLDAAPLVPSEPTTTPTSST